jgi:transposase
LLDWPPYSSDINLIKHVWKKLKEIVHKRYSELINMGKSKGDLRALSTAIVEAWKAIPQA